MSPTGFRSPQYWSGLLAGWTGMFMASERWLLAAVAFVASVWCSALRPKCRDAVKTVPS